jgi:hypothetical protein
VKDSVAREPKFQLSETFGQENLATQNHVGSKYVFKKGRKRSVISLAKNLFIIFGQGSEFKAKKMTLRRKIHLWELATLPEDSLLLQTDQQNFGSRKV